MKMALMLVAAVALSARQPDLVVRVHEPTAPASQSLEFSATCSGSTLRVRNIGVARPSTARPAVMVDNRRVAGPTSPLIEFLDQDDAVYRFSAQCANGGDRFTVRVYRASMRSGQAYRYDALGFHVGRNGAVRLMERNDTDAEGFWFR
jgi:hypothetical protein